VVRNAQNAHNREPLVSHNKLLLSAHVKVLLPTLLHHSLDDALMPTALNAFFRLAGFSN
jgi:hypothetical protein